MERFEIAKKDLVDRPKGKKVGKEVKKIPVELLKARRVVGLLVESFALPFTKLMANALHLFHAFQH